ncbi:MAG TPA: hypothetical protein VGJ60_17485 [Chloroflexota bacterium]
MQLLQGNALLAQHYGDYAAARVYAEQGATIAPAHGDARSLCEILTAVGFVCRVQSDWETARRALEESAVVARESGNVFAEAASLLHLGMVALDGAHDGALTLPAEPATPSRPVPRGS